jgi:hypothetical protein
VTRIGKIELRVLQDRQGRFSTELFERYQRSEKVLMAALTEMYIQGVSTRKVKAITEELIGHSFSASSSSRGSVPVGLWVGAAFALAAPQVTQANPAPAMVSMVPRVPSPHPIINNS